MATAVNLMPSNSNDPHHHPHHHHHHHHHAIRSDEQAAAAAAAHEEWPDMESLKVTCSSISSSNYSSMYSGSVTASAGGGESSADSVAALSPSSSKYSSFDEQQHQHQHQHDPKRSSSACTLSSHDSDVIIGGIGGNGGGSAYYHLERKSYRPFRNNEEYLVAMKEDLAEWLNTLYHDLDLNADNFISRVETGAILCRHANSVLRRLRELHEMTSATNATNNNNNNNNGAPLPLLGSTKLAALAPDELYRDVHVKLSAQPGTFQARDNVANFIDWCRRIRIHDCLLFETEDLVARKNVKSFVLCLLEVARFGAQFGLLAPTLVQFEQEIDQELEKEQQLKHSAGQDNNNPLAVAEPVVVVVARQQQPEQQQAQEEEAATEQAQITNNDLESLHEKVVNLLSRCTCPVQFYLEHLSEGKYRIGDNKTLIFVRILRNHVMVRVGGGWDTLEHYLEKHDPCRCRSGRHHPGSARVTLNNGAHMPAKLSGSGLQVTYERPEFSSPPQPSSVPLTRPHRSLASIQCSPTPARRRLVRPTSVTHNLNCTSVGVGHTNGDDGGTAEVVGSVRRVSTSSSESSTTSLQHHHHHHGANNNALLDQCSMSSNSSLVNLNTATGFAVPDRNNNIKPAAAAAAVGLHHAANMFSTPQQQLKPKKAFMSASGSHANLAQAGSRIPAAGAGAASTSRKNISNHMRPTLSKDCRARSNSTMSISGRLNSSTSMLALNSKIPCSLESAKLRRESLPHNNAGKTSQPYTSRYASHTHLERLGAGGATPSQKATARYVYSPVKQKVLSNSRAKLNSTLDLSSTSSSSAAGAVSREPSTPSARTVTTSKVPTTSHVTPVHQYRRHYSSHNLSTAGKTNTNTEMLDPSNFHGMSLVAGGDKGKSKKKAENGKTPTEVSAKNCFKGSATSLNSTASTSSSTSSSNVSHHHQHHHHQHRPADKAEVCGGTAPSPSSPSHPRPLPPKKVNSSLVQVCSWLDRNQLP